MTNLLKAEAEFRFDEAEEDAFVNLKIALISYSVLNLYRINIETELHTDASKHGYGAILVQRNADTWHIVYYASEKTTLAEKKYCSYELEGLAIVKSLRKFKVYLLGILFRIVTDCRAFALTINKKDLYIRVARWVLLLEEFDYVIEHRPDTSMVHVDALNRNPPICMLINSCEDGLAARLRKVNVKMIL